MATSIKYQYRDLHDPAARQVYDDSSDTQAPQERKRQTPTWNEEANAPASQRHAWPLPASYRWVLDVVLVLVIGFLLWDRSNQRAKCGPWQSTGDITGFAPRMSQQVKTFKPDMAFVPENGSEFFTEAVQEKWLSIIPKGLGYVRVKNPEHYHSLPTPLEEYAPYTFTTSMTHQLHCLHAIVANVASRTANSTDTTPQDGAWHLGHCFEYLRQSIMCSADMALEGQQTTFPAGQIGSDGWDAQHVCKDYDQVLAHLEDKRANDDVWI